MNSRESPLITVGITCYNAAATVRRALESALKQRWPNLEVVAVDDCSNDGSWEILQGMAVKHSKIRVFVNDANTGVAASRNRILAEARGEFVAFFDDDDESLRDRIALQYARIVDYERNFADGAPVICHTARKLIYAQGKERVEPTMGQTEGVRAPSGNAVAERILLGTPLKDGYGACPTCSQMARLSVYRSLNGFDPAFRRAEDTDFNIRLAQAGGHFVGIGRPLVIQSMTKTSEKSLAEEYRNWTLLMEKHRAIMDYVGQYSFCCRWTDAKRAWLERRRGAFVAILFLLAVTHPVLAGRRLFFALRNVELNRAFRHFHRAGRS
ncbi:MAG: hypothetical protein AMS22_04555 [Thiotrichales bacterium SG8_50]|jgi:glycosyltransferase involved in cell wall biosynthesis|nr:MAG: hypothetical protein AMS22_04555 [Thiotrichales bacterium SG8_50]